MKYQPYDKLLPVIKQGLSEDIKAEILIRQWLEHQGFRPMTTLAMFSFEPDKYYVEPSKLEFANFNGHMFTSMRNIIAWTGLTRSSLYRKLKENRELFSSLGTRYVVESEGSTRLIAANKLEIDSYVRLTRHLTLFSPRSVFLFMVTGKSPFCTSFRQFIVDHSPQNPYSLPKLKVTLLN